MPDWVYYDKENTGLKKAVNALNAISNELNLPTHIINYSTRIYQILYAKKLTSGRRREVLIGACIYLSCQGVNYPIDLNDLCKACDCNKKELIRQRKFIKQHIKTNEEGITTESYVKRYAYELGLKPTEVTKAIKTADKVDKELINHKTRIKAAVTIYLITKDNKSIREIARLTGLSRDGLYNAYKKVKHLMSSTNLLSSNNGLHIIEKKKKC